MDSRANKDEISFAVWSKMTRKEKKKFKSKKSKKEQILNTKKHDGDADFNKKELFLKYLERKQKGKAERKGEEKKKMEKEGADLSDPTVYERKKKLDFVQATAELEGSKYHNQAKFMKQPLEALGAASRKYKQLNEVREQYNQPKASVPKLDEKEKKELIEMTKKKGSELVFKNEYVEYTADQISHLQIGKAPAKDKWVIASITDDYMNLLKREFDPFWAKIMIYFSCQFYQDKIRKSILKEKDEGMSLEKLISQHPTKRTCKKAREAAFVFIPILFNGHFSLVCYEKSKKTLSFYDPMNNSPHNGPEIMDHIYEFFVAMDTVLKENDEPRVFTGVLKNTPLCPRQKNVFDCGIFTCIFAKLILQQEQLTFSQDDAETYRLAMAKEIKEGVIIGRKYPEVPIIRQ